EFGGVERIVDAGEPQSTSLSHETLPSTCDHSAARGACGGSWRRGGGENSRSSPKDSSSERSRGRIMSSPCPQLAVALGPAGQAPPAPGASSPQKPGPSGHCAILSGKQ